jgi:hypothetical protein
MAITQLVATKDFTVYCHHECFKTYMSSCMFTLPCLNNKLEAMPQLRKLDADFSLQGDSSEVCLEFVVQKLALLINIPLIILGNHLW